MFLVLTVLFPRYAESEFSSVPVPLTSFILFLTVLIGLLSSFIGNSNQTLG